MGCDWDAVCGYSTARMVRIRDRRLGIMYYTAVFLIVAYIAGYVVLYGQGYKAEAEIVGTVRLQLQRPTAEYRLTAAELGYCGNGTYGGPEGGTYVQHACRFMDQYDAVYPALEASATLLTTRATVTPQHLPPSCPHNSKANCAYVNGSSFSYYVGDAEFFTLLIDHTMSAPTLDLSRTASTMPGKLLDVDGVELDPCDDYTAKGWTCPSYINVEHTGHHDIIAMKTLMRAAGVSSLDTPLGGDFGAESKRAAGMILLVEIDYSNYESLGSQNVVYTYRVSMVDDAEFKVEEVLPGRGELGVNRTLIDRHGMRVVVIQEGRVGAFSFQTLLIQLVSSMGLLAVAKFVVDTILQYILPLRYIYRQYKTVTSIDFSDLTDEDRALFEQGDLVNPLPRLPDDALERLNHTRRRSARGSQSTMSRRLLNSSSSRGAFSGDDEDDYYSD